METRMQFMERKKKMLWQLDSMPTETLFVTTETQQKQLKVLSIATIFSTATDTVHGNKDLVHGN